MPPKRLSTRNLIRAVSWRKSKSRSLRTVEPGPEDGSPFSPDTEAVARSVDALAAARQTGTVGGRAAAVSPDANTTVTAAPGSVAALDTVALDAVAAGVAENAVELALDKFSADAAAAAASDAPPAAITVGSVSAIIGDDGVVRYIIERLADADTTTAAAATTAVSRRFSEWRALRLALPSAVQESLAQAAPFPPRRLHCEALCGLVSAPWTVGRHDDALLAERAIQLHQWMCALLALPAARASVEVRSFLQLEG